MMGVGGLMKESVQKGAFKKNKKPFSFAKKAGKSKMMMKRDKMMMEEK